MDIAWIVLDALSFEATPFAADGPDTMPKLEALAEEHGVVFTNAYAPGTASPSSHASMFTGELPSRTGMHEASPYYDGTLPTIGETLGQSHRSFMISYNPFIFNGLERGFDRTDDLRGAQYMLFDEATDPRRFIVEHHETPIPQRYIEFLRRDGKPIRSFLNGLNFKLKDFQTDLGQHAATEGASYQYTGEMNEKIRRFLDSEDGDAFVVANYMDIHPPLGASDDALDRFAPDTPREDLPIGQTSSEIIDRIDAPDTDGSVIEANAEALYHATIWDTDDALGPLVRELVESGTHVVVTADHGSRFTGVHTLDDRRIHVPLLVFAPDEPARTVEHTVNIRALAATTMAQVAPDDTTFSGYDLLSVTEDQLSITEFIHDSSPTGNSVSAFGDFDSIQYDLTGIKNGTRVDWIDGSFRESSDSDAAREIESVIEDLTATGLDAATDRVEYDRETEERLEDLGYL